MKGSFWAIAGIAALSAGGSGYMLVPGRATAPDGGGAARVEASPQQPTNNQSGFAPDIARAPITAPLQTNPFASWVPAPQPTPVGHAAAPARPVVPAFPYAYAGTLKKGREAAEVFLLKGKDLVPVK